MAVNRLREDFGLSISRACGLVKLPRSSFHYKAKTSNNEPAVIARMKKLIEDNRNMGLVMLHPILRREGLVINHKRTERIYREQNLTIKSRKRSKRVSVNRLQLEEPTRPNQHWAMDFVQDSLWSGRKFKILPIIDIFSKESLALEVDFSINGIRVTRVLDWLILTRGCPEAITIDNGPEFAGQAMDAWAYQHGVKLNFITPGKPIENAFIESFNGRLRHECLNQHYFSTLQEAKEITEKWRINFNTFRPHSSLKGQTPDAFTKAWKDKNQQPNNQETLLKVSTA